MKHFKHFSRPATLVAVVTLTCAACSLSACFGGSKKTQQDPYNEMSAEKIYTKGKQAAAANNFTAAIKDFEELESRYPYGEYTDKAQLALIHAYFKQDNAASALAMADRFIRVHPRHPQVDYAYYMKGVINYNENFSSIYQYFPIERSMRDPSLAQQAFDDFKILLQMFPDSTYATDAQQRMTHLRNQLAKYELHTANYYFTQKAFLAAANRAGYIVNTFDETEVIPDALILMVKAYKAMDMQELASQALKLLEHNFPNRVATSNLL